MESFQDLAVRFRAYHTNSLNVALHMVTTPAGMVSALVLAKQNWPVEVFAAVVAAYVGSLFFALRSTGLWVATTAWVAGLVTVSVLIAPHMALLDSLKLLALAYAGQELAHFITKERTFQSTYMNKGTSVPGLLLEHTYYLLPLCLDSLVHMKESFASWMVAHNYVVRCKLTSTEDRAALKDVYDFVTAANPRRDNTAHWWYQVSPLRPLLYLHVSHPAATFTLHPVSVHPNTLITPVTLNIRNASLPTPYTLCPIPYAPYPKPYALHPTP